jgi:hypothetical protein
MEIGFVGAALRLTPPHAYNAGLVIELSATMQGVIAGSGSPI